MTAFEIGALMPLPDGGRPAIEDVVRELDEAHREIVRYRHLLLAAVTLIYGVPTTVHRRVERDVRGAAAAGGVVFSRPGVDAADLAGLVDAVLELRPELRGHVGRRDG